MGHTIWSLQNDIEYSLQAKKLGFYLFWFLLRVCAQSHACKACGHDDDHGTFQNGLPTPPLVPMRSFSLPGPSKSQQHPTSPEEFQKKVLLFRNDEALADIVGRDHVDSVWELLTGIYAEEDRGGGGAPKPETLMQPGSWEQRDPPRVGDLVAGGAQPDVTEVINVVSLQRVMHAFEYAYHRRKAISLTLQESGTVVTQIGNTIGWIISLILVFLIPTFWAPDTVKEIVLALSAVLVSLTFVFGNTLGEVWPCHPFDVEDIISVDGDYFKVLYIALPYVSVARTSDNAYVKIATHDLRHARIHNVTRSKPKPDKPRSNFAPTMPVSDPVQERGGDFYDGGPSPALPVASALRVTKRKWKSGKLQASSAVSV